MATPFIVIGSKGTALPLQLQVLDGDLHLGKNKIPWSSQNPSELAQKTVAWVAGRNTPLTILLREHALSEGVIQAFAPVSWQKHGVRYFGTAYMKADWEIDDERPFYVAVEAAGWKFGVVEETRLSDGRNAKVFAQLDFSRATRIVHERADVRPSVSAQSKYNAFKIGHEYDRPTIAKMLGYKAYEAIGRGMVTPAGENKIVLLLTGEKELGLRDYTNSIVDGIVSTDGENGHRNDNRMIHSEEAGDEIHVFFRGEHRAPFVYEGTATLLDYEIHTEIPSKFRLTLDHHQSALETELRTHGDPDVYEGSEEGRKKFRQAIVYERDPKNRAAAIRIHGSICKVCGFDFNEVYGVDHARSYVEVHHVESITKGERKVNPATDLVPLCSNCHSMVHRKAGRIMSVDELKTLLRRRKGKDGGRAAVAHGAGSGE